MIPTPKPTASLVSQRPNFHLLLACVLVAALLAGCAPAASPTEPKASPSATALPSSTVPSADAAAVFSASTPLPVTATPGKLAPDAIWFTNPTDKALVRVDPKTDQVVGRIGLSGSIGPLVYTDGSVWVAQTVDNAGANLLRINPTSFAIEATIPIQYGTITSILPAAGSIWLGVAEPAGDLLVRQPGDYALPGGIARVDPASGVVAAYQRLGAVPADLQFFMNSLWALEQFDLTTAIGRLDPNTLQDTPLTGPPDTQESVYRLQHFALASSGIWATSADQRSRYFYRIDPTTGKVGTLFPAGSNPEDHPVDIAADESAVWVGLSSGAVLKVDPATGQIVAQAATQPGLTRLLLEPGGLWVENAVLETAWPLASATWTNLIEKDVAAVDLDKGSRQVPFKIEPFEIKTMRLVFETT
jgi:streptogramin lyase